MKLDSEKRLSLTIATVGLACVCSPFLTGIVPVVPHCDVFTFGDLTREWIGGVECGDGNGPPVRRWLHTELVPPSGVVYEQGEVVQGGGVLYNRRIGLHQNTSGDWNIVNETP